MINNQPTIEEHSLLRRRYESMAESAVKQSMQVNQLQKQLATVVADRTRFESQVVASQKTMQVVVDDYNNRDRVKNARIQLLIDQLKSHGIEPRG